MNERGKVGVVGGFEDLGGGRLDKEIILWKRRVMKLGRDRFGGWRGVSDGCVVEEGMKWEWCEEG